jgi:HD superfamily phosphohydrolase
VRTQKQNAASLQVTEAIIGESRAHMHKTVYQHHTVQCVELMCV